MSTLVSLLLAVVLNFLGIEVPEKVEDVTRNRNQVCEEQSQLLASNYIIKNEQLSKVKRIR